MEQSSLDRLEKDVLFFDKVWKSTILVVLLVILVGVVIEANQVNRANNNLNIANKRINIGIQKLDCITNGAIQQDPMQAIKDIKECSAIN